MSEGTQRRFRLGRRRTPPPTADAPCIPCGQKAGLREFSLNESAAPIADDAVPALAPNVQFAIAGDEVVLFDLVRSTSTLLNPTAALIWASVDGEAPIGSIIDDLVAETGADRSVIAPDVLATIARLVHTGIVIMAEPADQEHPAGEPSSAGDAEAGNAEAGNAEAGNAETGDAETEDIEAEQADAAREAQREARLGRVLDRIEWCPGAGPRRCAGIDVAVRTNDEALDQRLRALLGTLDAADGAELTLSILDRGPDAARRFRVLIGTETLQWAATERDAIDAAFTELNALAIARTRDRFVLHAGAVSRDGAVVVLAGPSGRGKSTLTAALVQRGFAYLSDEVVAIDPASLSVLTYPKPLDLDAPALELLGVDAPDDMIDGRKAKVEIERLGAASHETGPVRLLVLLGDPNDPDDPTRPRSPAENVIDLVSNTFASTFDERSAIVDPLAALAALAAHLPILRLERRSLDDACRAVVAELDAIVASDA